MLQKAIPVILGTLLLAITPLMFMDSPDEASAWTASGLATLYVGDDSFKNYDFTSDSPTSSNVDWPITMLFWNSADINKVKNAYKNHGWPSIGGTMKGYLNDGNEGGGWFWDGDKGVKTTGMCQAHMRLYGGPRDRMYNDSWGYYILGTTHRDYEWQVPQGFGWSEEAAHEACQTANQVGWPVAENWGNFYNAEAERYEISYVPYYIKHVHCDGNASAVRVP